MNVRKGFARLAQVTALIYAVAALVALGSVAYGAWREPGAGMSVFRVDLNSSGDVLRACGPGFVSDPCDKLIERGGTRFLFPYDATNSEIERALEFAIARELTARRSAREIGGLEPLHGPTELRELALRRARELSEASAQAAAQGERLFVQDAGSNEFEPAEHSSAMALGQASRSVPHVFVWKESASAAINFVSAVCRNSHNSCGEWHEGPEIAPSIAERFNFMFRAVWQPALLWFAVYLAFWAVFRAIRYVALGFMDSTAGRG